MDHVGAISIVLSSGLLLLIVELVRRRALSERYSLLWLLTGSVLVVLSVWRGGLILLARALGIYYAPTALMVVGIGFILLILLHYSMIISKMAERNKELAQHHAMLTWRVSELERAQEEAGVHPASRTEPPQARTAWYDETMDSVNLSEMAGAAPFGHGGR